MIWACFITFLFLIAIICLKNANKPLECGEFLNKCQRDEFVKNVASFLSQMPRPTSGGAGVNVEEFDARIEKAVKVLRKKAKRGEPFFDFETRLYENHFKIKGALSENFDGFCLLPHAEDKPRVVLLCEKIVESECGILEKDNVELAFSEADKLCGFGYDEIAAAKKAFTYVLLKYVAALADECVRLNRAKFWATKLKRVPRKHLSDNGYLHFVIKGNLSVSQQIQAFLAEGGKSASDVDRLFSEKLIECSVVCENVINSLFNLGGTVEDVEKCYSPEKILQKSKAFSSTAKEDRPLVLKRFSALATSLNVDERDFARKLLELETSSQVGVTELCFASPRQIKKALSDGVFTPKSDKSAPIIALTAFLTSEAIVSVGIGLLCGIGGASYSVSLLSAVTSAVAFLRLSERAAYKIASFFSQQKPVLHLECDALPDGAATLVVVPAYLSSVSDAKRLAVSMNALKASNGGKNISFLLLADLKSGESEVLDDDAWILKTLQNELSGVALAVRKRTFVDGKWQPRERKRGALEDLHRLLAEGLKEPFGLLLNVPPRPVFTVVADEDSRFLPGAISRAVKAMLHPDNLKVEMMAFCPKINSFSIKTAFSKLFSDGAGADVYFGSCDNFSDAFGKGIFTGKGIYRLSAFHEKLTGRFAENKLLSHDVLEGSLLNTRAVDVDVFEDAPENVGQYLTRRMRWNVGDVGLLYFLERIGKSIPLEYRLLMFCNAFSKLSAICSVAVLTLTFFGASKLAFAVAALLCSAFQMLSLVSAAKLLFTERFGYALRKFLKRLVALLVRPFALLGDGVFDTMTFFAAVYKLAAGKNMLKWKTFGSGKKSESVETAKTDAMLLAAARAAYAYFSDNTVDGLVADHVIFGDRTVSADYTSPTNVGFSLVAEIAATSLGFSSKEAAAERVQTILQAVNKLEKFRGNLFNWYSVKTKKPLEPRFVSSVDSGNFVAALIACGSFFGGKIEKTCKKMTKETDFDLLFDKKRKQFYIGYNVLKNKFEGHYDLKMSEASLLYYVYGALKRSTDGYFSTEKILLSAAGGNVLASWSGTMFEYLMPGLFLPTDGHGAVHRSVKLAVKAQMKSTCHGFWGISESGNADLDECGNFRYEAYGINSIALRDKVNSCVISPYSSALCLEVFPDEAISNLRALRAEAYGKYGFFEAIDFRDGTKRVVSEYMAHHVGMTLAAVCNYLRSGAVRKAFMADERMKGAEMLLTERAVDSKPRKAKQNGFEYKRFSGGEFFEKYGEGMLLPRFNLIEGDGYNVAVNDFGEGYSYADGCYVTRFRKDLCALSGSFFVIRDEDDGVLISPTFSPLKKRGDFSAEFLSGKAVFKNGFVSEEVTCPSLYCGERRVLEVENTAKTAKTYTVFYYSEPLLGSLEADYAHRCFNNLFCRTTSSTDSDGVLRMTCRRRFAASEEEKYCVLTAKGLYGATGVADRFAFIGKGRTLADALIYEKLPESRFGDTVEPCLAFYGELTVAAGATGRVEVSTAFATDEKQALKLLERPLSPYFAKGNGAAVTCDMSGEAKRYFNRLFAALLYVPYSDGKLKAMLDCANGRAKLLTSDFSRKALYFGYGEECDGDFVQYLEGFYRLLRFGIDCNLVVGYVEKERYGGEVYRKITSRLRTELLGNRIFLVELSGEDESVEKYCFRSFNGFDDERKVPVVKPKNRKKTTNRPKILGDFDVGNGSFVFSDGNLEYVSDGRKPHALPYSDIVAERNGGFVCTDCGAGHSWFFNSRECKVTVWDSDTVSPPVSEKFVLTYGGKSFSLTENSTAVFKKGAVEFFAETTEARTKLTQYMLSDGTCKRYEAEITSKSKNKKEFCLITDFDLSLGYMPDGAFTIVKAEGDKILAKNIRNGIGCVLKLPKEARAVLDAGNVKNRCDVGEYFQPKRRLNVKCFASVAKFTLSYGESIKLVYTLCPNVKAADQSVVSDESEEKAVARWESLNPVKITGGDKKLALLANWLPYQTLSCRINARASFWQVGGAYGFRDVLQDALSALWFDAKLAREIILDCASKQYEEGDAVHWWHNTGYGIRTRISDDRLFLAFAVTEYIKATGDREILDVCVPYLTSPPLADFENDRFERLVATDYAERLSDHVLKAFEKTARCGENGLIMVYGGDWNDALNNVGDEKRGESVWLSMFFYKCLKDFVEYISDSKTKLFWIDFAEKLKKSVKKTFENGYFKRLVTKDGLWLGSKNSEVIKIDVISQAWAVLSEIASDEEADKCLDAAMKLVGEDGIVRLLDPPVNDTVDLGYISRYPEGIRENGGQYTHGAIWLVSALFKRGRTEQAYKVLDGINPVTQNLLNGNYRGEPYVLSADVYTSKDNYGRSGWSWYTGSASWCFKVMMEDLFGISLFKNSVSINPRGIPEAILGTVLTLKHAGGEVSVEYKRGEKALKADGVNILGTDRIGIVPGKKITVEVLRP